MGESNERDGRDRTRSRPMPVNDRGRFSESGAVVTMRDDVELDNLDNIFL